MLIFVDLIYLNVVKGYKVWRSGYAELTTKFTYNNNKMKMLQKIYILQLVYGVW